MVNFSKVIGQNIESEDSTVKFEHYEKGKNMAGLLFTGGWGGSRGLIVHLNSKYGRFFIPKFQVGADFNTNIIGRYDLTNFGPYLRWYVLNKRFTPILETNFYYITDKFTGSTGETISYRGRLAMANAGLSYMFKSKKKTSIGIEAIFGIGHRKIYRMDNSNLSIRSGSVFRIAPKLTLYF